MSEINLADLLLSLPLQFPYECIGLLAVLLYIQLYILGHSRNKKLALKFVNSTYALLTDHFAHLGITKQEKGPLIQAESASSFKFYASGRLNVFLMVVTLELKKRQDLLYSLLFSFFWPERDTLQFDIPLSSAPQPIVFAIVRKRDAKTYKENHIDLKYLCEKIAVERIEERASSLVLLAEGKEPLATIFDAKLLATLTKFEKHIAAIHFTDQKNLLQNQSHLRIQVLNYDKLQPEEICELTQFALVLADKLALYKLPASLKQANEQERQKLEEIKQKDEKMKKIEEAQRKKTEKLQKEKQKLYSLPREQQIRLQEKEKKDELKKKYQKRTMYM